MDLHLERIAFGYIVGVTGVKRSDTAGRIYEFGGPQVYSFKALLELLLTALNRQRVLIPIPFAVAEIQAGFA